MLYSGGFIPRGDRQSLDRLLGLGAQELAAQRPVFEDPRLQEMLFRYRARNYPQTLDAEEQARWEQHRFERLTEGVDGRGLDLERYHALLAEHLARDGLSDRDRDILQALQSWGDELLA